MVGYFSYDYIKYAEPTLNLDAPDTDNFKDIDAIFNEITKALKELSGISSNLQKIEWLKNHNDEDLKDVFKWYFDSSRKNCY